MNQEPPNFDVLHTLFKDYPEKLATIKAWEKDFKKAALKDDLYSHEAVKQLVELLQQYISMNGEKLKTQRRADYANDELFFEARGNLLTENNCWSIIANFFTRAEAVKQSIASKVKETTNLPSNQNG